METNVEGFSDEMTTVHLNNTFLKKNIYERERERENEYTSRGSYRGRSRLPADQGA